MASQHISTPAFGQNIESKYQQINQQQINQWNYREKQWVKKDKQNKTQHKNKNKDNQSSELKRHKNWKGVKATQNTSLDYQVYGQFQSQEYTDQMIYLYEIGASNFEEQLQNCIQDLLFEEQSQRLFKIILKSSKPKDTQIKIEGIYKLIQKIKQKQIKNIFIQKLAFLNLKQVPLRLIPLSQKIVQLLTIINPKLTFKDVLHPKKQLIELLIEQYFNTQNLEVQTVLVQGYLIDISNPRNLLNILLYVNQAFKFQVSHILYAFCTKLLIYGYVNIIQRLIKKENIFKICGVSNSIIMISVYKYLAIKLKKDPIKITLFEIQRALNLIPFEGDKKQVNQKHSLLHLIKYLLNKQCIFDMQKLLIAKNTKRIIDFFKTIISQNSMKILRQIDYCYVYKKMWQIQEESSLSFFTFELVDILKMVSVHFFKHQFLTEGIYVLRPIFCLLQRIFIVDLLIRYCQGKLINRFIGVDLKIIPFDSIFPQFKKKNYEKKSISLNRDFFINPKLADQNKWNCSWEIFQQVYDSTFYDQDYPLEFRYIFYYDFNLAKDIVASNLIKKQKFTYFLSEMCQYLKQQTYNQVQNNQFKLVIDDILNKSDDEQLNKDKNENLSQEYQNSYSMKIIPCNYQNSNVKPLDKMKCYRSKSDQTKSMLQNLRGQSKFQYLKLLEDQKSIIKELKQIYYNIGKETFVFACQIVNNKIKLYHIQEYAQLCSLNLEFNLQSLINFNVFFVKEPQDCFDLMSQYLMSEVTIENFWIISLILKILFDNNITQLSEILVQKIIKYDKPDNAEIIQYLLNTKEVRFDRNFLELMEMEAMENQLYEIRLVIRSYLQNLQQ